MRRARRRRGRSPRAAAVRAASRRRAPASRAGRRRRCRRAARQVEDLWDHSSFEYKTYVLFCKVRTMPRLTETEKETRRRRVLDGARRCFAHHGYEGATVVRLEAEIGLSRGAIFNWFP